MKIRAAFSEDLDVIKTLLTNNQLVASDVHASLLDNFLVAESEDGALIGSIGLERFGQDALLRSLVVARSACGMGLGGSLLSRMELHARASGVSNLWLLTTTAGEFFRKKGYDVVARESAPIMLQTSSQFADLCPATAVCMLKWL